MRDVTRGDSRVHRHKNVRYDKSCSRVHRHKNVRYDKSCVSFVLRAHGKTIKHSVATERYTITCLSSMYVSIKDYCTSSDVFVRGEAAVGVAVEEPVPAGEDPLKELP